MKYRPSPKSDIIQGVVEPKKANVVGSSQVYTWPTNGGIENARNGRMLDKTETGPAEILKSPPVTWS